MIRIAAVGDVHFGPDAAGSLRPHLDGIAADADVLLLAGDLTRIGRADEAAALAEELADVEVPVVAVLGNHDYHQDHEEAIERHLADAGVRVLEGDTEIVEIGGARLGIAGLKGFGGGFAGACGSDFGEPEMKAFIRHTKDGARRLQDSLEELQDVDVRVALLHYAPVEATVVGERLEIYPFLGSYLLGEAIDSRRRRPRPARPRPPRHAEGDHARRHPRAQRGPAPDRAGLRPLLSRRGACRTRRPARCPAGRAGTMSGDGRPEVPFSAIKASLKAAAGALQKAEIPFMLGGGLAVWARGGADTDHDLDLMIRPEDAARALEVLRETGMRTEHPPEHWLVKAYDGEVLIDLIFEPSGLPIDDDVFARAEELDVYAMRVLVMPLEDVLVTKLLAMGEHQLDYDSVLEIARTTREQIDWHAVRERTSESPYAQAFFTLVEALGVIEPASHA